MRKLAALVALAGCVSPAPAPGGDRPHIVLFIADDHGWRDSGAYGNGIVRTPNIDRLAAEGLRFTHAFAASPSCAPSRSAIYTGLNPARNGAHPNHSQIRAGIKTFPVYLKELGYRVVLAGKTHIGPRDAFPFEYVPPGPVEDLLADHAKGRPEPLCLIMAVADPHVPWAPNDGYDPARVDLPPYFVDTPETRDARTRYYSDVTSADRQLGEVLASLRKHGLEGKTLFIYTADQGAQWPRAKWTLYDAGTRVPFIVRWPGVTRPGTPDAMLSLIDLLPTFIEAAGGTPPAGIDGRSFLGVLRGERKEHREVIFSTHSADGKMNDYPTRSVRTRTHKYILNLRPENLFTTHITNGVARSGRDYWESWKKKAAGDPEAAALVRLYQHRPAEELFDLARDPHEMRNIAAENPELVARLRAQVRDWMRDQRDETGKATPPNFIFILADDLGWAELGSYGNRFNETPNLDRMAAEGLRLTHAYASAPVCSPTRAALLTGKHPARVGITNFLGARDPLYLDPRETTLNEVLREAGYVTGVIGKWHLTGDYGPKRGEPRLHGWDEVLCSETSYIGGGSYFHPYAFMPEVAARAPGEYLTDRLAEEAADFIRRHRDRPFFLYLSHYAPHTRLAGKPDKVEKHRAKPGAGKDRNNPELAAMLESIDEGVGRILRTLDELRLSDRTLVVFTSDNGGESRVTSNAPLRAGKSHLYEGGIRVPFLARWPGVVRAGQTSDVPVASADLFPTALHLARRAGPPADGQSLVPLFSGQGGLERDALFWHYPLAKPHFLGGRSSGAVRKGDWKLIEFYDTGAVELYDLKEDPGEARDLAAARPEKAAELRKILKEELASFGKSLK